MLLQAAILQQTAEYIYQLEQEKTSLLSQNCQLKRLVNQHEGGDMPIKKRKAESQGKQSRPIYRAANLAYQAESQLIRRNAKFLTVSALFVNWNERFKRASEKRLFLFSDFRVRKATFQISE